MKILATVLSCLISFSAMGFQTGQMAGHGYYKSIDGDNSHYDVAKTVARNDDGTMTIDTTITMNGENHAWSMIIEPETDGFFAIWSKDENGELIKNGDGACFKKSYHLDDEAEVQNQHHKKICTYTVHKGTAHISVTLKMGEHGTHAIGKMENGDSRITWKEHLHRS
ncbi:MAG: hypothetical protein AB8C84_07790 [Oligoflexales bacterium]